MPSSTARWTRRSRAFIRLRRPEPRFERVKHEGPAGESRRGLFSVTRFLLFAARITVPIMGTATYRLLARTPLTMREIAGANAGAEHGHPHHQDKSAAQGSFGGSCASGAVGSRTRIQRRP